MLGSTGGSGFFGALKKKSAPWKQTGFPRIFQSMESKAGIHKNVHGIYGWMVWFTTGYPQRDSGSTGVLEVLWGWGVKKWTLSSRSVSINVAVPGQALSQDLVRWRSHHQYPSVIFNGKCSKENNSNIYIYIFMYIYIILIISSIKLAIIKFIEFIKKSPNSSNTYQESESDSEHSIRRRPKISTWPALVANDLIVTEPFGGQARAPITPKILTCKPKM